MTSLLALRFAAVWAAAFATQDLAPPLDTASLAEGPYARMHMLWEKTLLKVDVLTLDVRVGPETEERLRAIAAGRADSRARADSLAAAAIDARDAFISIRFERDVSLGQFLDGVRDNLRHARDAGIIDAAAYDTITAGLPRWFGFLAERGIRDGDRILYRIRGDTLRTVYVAREGGVRLDQT
ncbi:MAG: hypothetical protein ACREKI_10010, partial [Gemmatimonadota bacterium]